jgi:UDP-N-acetylglucosamine 2-epimerase (non-hydrolysing)
MKQKLIFCIGTRPEAIKLAPLILAAKDRGLDAKILSTGQHRKMLDPILDFFKLKPDFELSILKSNQSLAEMTASILTKTSEIFKNERPYCVFVQGDTTTAFASALAAFYEKIKIAHVEAGLRTHERYSPFPEEMNRRQIASLADYHFAPTQSAKDNLTREYILQNVFVTGNTGIDALRITSQLQKNLNTYTEPHEKLILVTCHRRENHGEPLLRICDALLQIVNRFEDVKIVFPVHLNPNVQKTVHEKLDQHPRIQLIEPLNYPEFSKMMQESFLLITDSGGVQEEAPYFKKPIFVMRESTERPEGIEAKVAELVGSESEKIVSRVSLALTDPGYYQSFQKSVNPYGDGHASEKILDLMEKLGH